MSESTLDLEEIDGAILSVHVRNFFCHDNLDVKFSKNVNFIVGRNGSGKSAILTALVVGLGGRAAATNRGNNLHSFIKKGTNSTTVEIKIKNNSQNGYRHELYGDSITIIRTITSSGGSSYKIKNHNGIVVSTKSVDVGLITTALDIQVDNPICILNQDEARNFHAADTRKKYIMFRKAINLDLTEANYNKTVANCEKATSVWTLKNEAFAELEKELRKWELMYEQLQTKEEIHQKQMKLQDEYYWSEIAEFEEELDRLLAFKEKQSIKVQKLLDKENGLKGRTEEILAKIRELKSQSESLGDESGASDSYYRAKTEYLQKAREKFKEFRHGYNKKRELVQQEENKVRDLKEEITAATEGNKANERAVLESEIEKLRSQMKEANVRKETVDHELNQTRSAISHYQTNEDNVNAIKQNASQRMKQCASLLRELDVKGKEVLAVYGRKMVELVDAVKDNYERGKFSEMPRGPVGAYLKVKDKKWSSALEHIIGGSLQSFCVNTAQDSRTLISIINKIYGDEHKPPVTSGKFFHQVHNVSENAVRAPRGLFSALDCLQISDPVVANYLIDSNGLESILMVSKDDDAFKLCENIQSVPINCKKIVTLDGSEFFAPPNYRSYGGAGRPSKFLQVSSSERKMQLQVDSSKAEIEFESAEVEIQKLRRERATLVNRETELNSQLHKLMRLSHNLESKLIEVKERLRDSEGSYINVLVEELQSTESNLKNLKLEAQNLFERDEELKKAVKTCESEVRKIRDKMDTDREKLMLNNEEISKLQMEHDRANADCQSGVQLLKEEHEKLNTVESTIGQQENLVRKKVMAAEQLSNRINNPRKKDIVVEELKKIQAKINSITKDGPSKREVAANLVELQKKRSETKKVLHRLSALITEIKNTSEQHLQYCLEVQTLIARRVQYCFQSILTLRGYSGSMNINHGKGILEIKCTGRDSANERHANSTSSLSGGERSYSTVAFIMALWDCVEMPFYFMDEFDVFMDNINRKIVMELLVDHALKNDNRQFVFLTPQDASSVTAGPKIKIHRMADPVRSSLIGSG